VKYFGTQHLPCKAAGHKINNFAELFQALIKSLLLVNLKERAIMGTLNTITHVFV
jgi:ABC-type transport system involved in Fe-S cluster assembly fused permease/ATPase subunit